MRSTVVEVAGAVGEIASAWASDRLARQSRRRLDRQDFDLLRDAGILTLPAPTDVGGLWEGPQSVRPICEVYRSLASADPSVALVSSMHPA
ncbi:MAG: hypothetical protein AVDCRST_MAG50-1410, partial [uncultured Acidimicrobiales bacterium]